MYIFSYSKNDVSQLALVLAIVLLEEIIAILNLPSYDSVVAKLSSYIAITLAVLEKQLVIGHILTNFVIWLAKIKFTWPDLLYFQ